MGLAHFKILIFSKVLFRNDKKMFKSDFRLLISQDQKCQILSHIQQAVNNAQKCANSRIFNTRLFIKQIKQQQNDRLGTVGDIK